MKSLSRPFVGSNRGSSLVAKLFRRETWAFLGGLILGVLDTVGIIGDPGVVNVMEVTGAFLGVGIGGAVIRGHQHGERIWGSGPPSQYPRMEPVPMLEDPQFTEEGDIDSDRDSS